MPLLPPYPPVQAKGNMVDAIRGHGDDEKESMALNILYGLERAIGYDVAIFGGSHGHCARIPTSSHRAEPGIDVIKSLGPFLLRCHLTL